MVQFFLFVGNELNSLILDFFTLIVRGISDIEYSALLNKHLPISQLYLILFKANQDSEQFLSLFLFIIQSVGFTNNDHLESISQAILSNERVEFF
jgi:hypothetical protein